MQLDPETIAAIEAIVNRIFDEREAQKATLAEKLAAQVRQQAEKLLSEMPDAKTRFAQAWAKAERRQQERANQGRQTPTSEAPQ